MNINFNTHLHRYTVNKTVHNNEYVVISIII